MTAPRDAGLDVLLVDGRLSAATGGATFETVNPVTEAVLRVAAAATPAALGAARAVFDETSWPRDPPFRARCLHQSRDAMARHADELRELTVAGPGRFRGVPGDQNDRRGDLP